MKKYWIISSLIAAVSALFPLIQTTGCGILEKTVKRPSPMNNANYNEANVPQYELPDPLAMQDGEVVKNRLIWVEKRRSEILGLYEKEVYGRVPEWVGAVTFETTMVKPDALDGKATMKEVRASFTNNGKSATMDILVFLPNGKKEPCPLFLGLNFFGNHTVHANKDITAAKGYVVTNAAMGVESHHQAQDVERGAMASRWPVEEIVGRGYGLATVFCGDIDPDFDDGFQNGIHPLFYKDGQTEPEPDEWGSISAWAWGLSRAMDFLETDPAINENRIAVMGHSRLGKAALWAGARDKRFAVVLSNNSGCGGTALFRREFGETIHASLAYAPQWYCANFKKYDEAENVLPVDQHLLLSLIAPRPLYVASAEEDAWADPKGEFLSAQHAGPVYELFRKEALTSDPMPEVNNPLMKQIGYHIRSGKHGVTDYDWQRFMEFADKHFAYKKKAALTFDDGPDPLYTVEILDILEQEQVPATFFLVGKFVKQYPEVVKRMHDGNHLIGNHTFSHPHLGKITDDDAVLAELTDTDSALAGITGKHHPYFRPSYGHLRDDQKSMLEKHGFKVEWWDIDPQDWDVEHVDKNEIVNAIKENLFDGANILLHSADANEAKAPEYRSRDATIAALPEIIRHLKAKDYEIVTMDKLQ